LALFIALGGVSYAAAKLPKNSVGSAQIKKNAVISSKIKKNAVTGSKIKSQTITGEKIKLSTLGTVPSASSATSADNWTSAAGPVLKRVAPSADNAIPGTARTLAAPVELASYGTVSVYGKCFTSAGVLYFEVYAATSTNGALLNSTTANFTGDPAYLDTTTTETTRMIIGGSVSSGGAMMAGPPYIGSTVLIGPDGKGLNLLIDAFAKNGDLLFGNGPYGVGQSCLFQSSGEKLNIG
jgi:hypothetical protein